jgi:hypothetical protein
MLNFHGAWKSNTAPNKARRIGYARKLAGAVLGSLRTCFGACAGHARRRPSHAYVTNACMPGVQGRAIGARVRAGQARLKVAAGDALLPCVQNR